MEDHLEDQQDRHRTKEDSLQPMGRRVPSRHKQNGELFVVTVRGTGA